MHRTSFLLAVLVVGAALTTVSCGPTKKVHTDLSSRGGDTVINYGKLAECNKIEASSINVNGQISTYYDPITRQLVHNYTHVNLTSIPAEIKTSDNHYLQIFRWSERTPGSRNVNSIPVRMYFIQKLTGMTSNSSPVDRISKSTIENIISTRQLGDIGITLNNFFEQHFIVLTGMELQWEAISIAYYNSSLGSQAVGYGDVLLPAFSADPNVFASNTPATSLQVLHPNYSYRNSGASENDFFQLTEQYCAGFLQGIRYPASLPQPESETGILASIRNFFSSLQKSFVDILERLRGN